MLSDDAVEDRIRRHFTGEHRSGDLDRAEALVAAVLLRHRRQRARRTAATLCGAAAVALVGVALVVTAVLPGGAPATGGRPASLLRVSGYEFHLPGSFRLTSAVRTPCRTFVTIGGPAASGVTALAPYATGAIASASAADGGCLSMLLTPPVAPTPTDPLPYLRTGGAVTNTPVRVGRFSGWLTTQGRLSGSLEAQGLVPAGAPRPDLQLSVEIPQGGGVDRFLEVGSEGIGASTLVQIVAGGLSD